MNATEFLLPMRPGANIGSRIPPGWAPAGWFWQPKLNDERAMLRIEDGALYNRHGALFDATKAAAFRRAVASVRAALAGVGPWADLGLLGFREKSTYGESRGAVVVFDVPGPAPWVYRRTLLAERFRVLGVLTGEVPKAGEAYRLVDHDNPGELFFKTMIPGLEGVVGRNGQAPYVSGDSREMAKCRWAKG